MGSFERNSGQRPKKELGYGEKGLLAIEKHIDGMMILITVSLRNIKLGKENINKRRYIEIKRKAKKAVY